MIHETKQGKEVIRTAFLRPRMSMVAAYKIEPMIPPMRGMTASQDPSSFVIGIVEFSLRSFSSDGDGQPECIPLVIIAKVPKKKKEELNFKFNLCVLLFNFYFYVFHFIVCTIIQLLKF